MEYDVIVAPSLAKALSRRDRTPSFSAVDRSFKLSTLESVSPAFSAALEAARALESAPEDALAGGADEPAESVASTDMAAPLAHVLEDPNLRALVLFGDGDWNTGKNPTEVAMNYRMQGVPILTCAVGSRTALPDVEFLPLEPPAFALVGKPLAIPIAIHNSKRDDTNASL